MRTSSTLLRKLENIHEKEFVHCPRSVLVRSACYRDRRSLRRRSDGDIMTVKLPYAASVGKVTLPAGEYTIRDLKDDGSTTVLSIQSAAGPGASALVTQVSSPNNKPANQTEVFLRHNAGQYHIDK